LIAPTDDCDGASFEIDLGADITDPGYKNSVKGKEVKIKKVPTDELGDAGVETLAAFTASVPSFTDGVPDNVCVTVITTLPPTTLKTNPFFFFFAKSLFYMKK